MSLKKYPPIKELFAALPPDTLKSGDNAILKALSAAMAALREPGHETHVFTVEMRGVILTRLKQSVAEVLDPHIPRARRGRPRAPLGNEISAFMDALALLSLSIEVNWSVPSNERVLPRAALDNAYNALWHAANTLHLDIAPLADTYIRLSEGIDAYATRTFSEAPIALVKSTAGAQMNLVLKTLAREART